MQLDQIDRKLDEQKGLLISLERQGREHRRATFERPGGLNARAATCSVLAHVEGCAAEDVAREHFATDRDLDRLITLRSVTNPANSTVCAVVDTVRRWILPGWIFTHIANGEKRNVVTAGQIPGTR